MDAVTQAQAERAQLQPEPIPEAWVLSGTPQARSAELSGSPDGDVVVLWDCTAGEFVWRSPGHERIEILEGEAVVDDGSGPRTLRPGAQARFRAGAVARWRIPSYVKQVSYRRDPRPTALKLALWAARRLGLKPPASRTGPPPGASLPSHV